MVMSNFIDEAERHAELYGMYTKRQHEILKMIDSLTPMQAENSQFNDKLHALGINDTEIGWLKRTGHVLPNYLK